MNIHPESGLDPPKVLLVDDLENNLDLLEIMLRDLDVITYRALSGYEAIHLAAEHRFSLILLDIIMPGFDGYETAQGLRALEGNEDLSIIFVTADIQQKKNLFQGFETGAIDYIFKPVDKMMLVNKVKVFCKLHSQKTLLEQNNYVLAAENRRNQERLTAIENHLRHMKEDFDRKSDELIKKIKEIDDQSKRLTLLGTVPDQNRLLRESLIKLVNTSLEYWEQGTGKTKIELAEESNLWLVSRDGSSPRVKTLDRYLHLNSLPAKPRWKTVIDTAEYVLSNCKDIP
ncbi:MAG: response regulator, partial [Proteobacteria bacterium]|nr:response regulator [Pseudomonadota bacterium]